MLTYCLLTILLTFVSSTPEEHPEYRLPETIWPLHYNLTLNLPVTIFDTDAFSGVLNLKIKPSQNTKEIKLHSFSKIVFQEKIKLTTENGVEIGLNNDGFNNVTEILALTAAQNLLVNSIYVLTFNYTTELILNSNQGFYKSSYKENNKNKFLAITQFQYTFARRAFPCFDEPKFKAEFQIAIEHPSTLNALSNTQIESNVINNGVMKTIFKKTPVMSTYLVAFIVSEFTCTQSVTNIIDVPHRICSRKGTGSLRSVALDVGPKLLKALEEFTDIPYHYFGTRKIDQAAVPDLSFLAMENWGLVTYRENSLLWDKDKSSNMEKQKLETQMSHELSHMWFGNLVTTHWWSDIFLNEGFATYLQYFNTGEIERQWEMENQFVLQIMQTILVDDASQTSTPLSYSVSSPDQISKRFGFISYHKGGSVIRMVKHFMGSNEFKQGVQKYLKAHLFDNTEPKDLWAALGNVIPSGTLPTNLANVMDNWVMKAGYPLLEVKSDGNRILISQKRFYTDGKSSEEQWYVPITYTLSRDTNKFKDTKPKQWLMPNTTLKISNILTSEDDWIILNNRQTGYFRVSYSDDLLKRISNALNKPPFDGIHVLNRAHLIDDFYNLAKAGLKTYSEFLNFVVFLKKDTSYVPWYSAITAFSEMLQGIGDEQLKLKFSDYIQALINVVYNQVPFNDNRSNDQIYTYKRTLILHMACTINIQDCIDNSVEAFKLYKNHNMKPDKNLKAIIYCNGLRHSENASDDWNFLWNKYKEENLASEKNTLLTALGCSKDKTILKDYLKKSIDSTSEIKTQDALYVFFAVTEHNLEGVDIAAEFLYENHKDVATFYSAMNSMSSLINDLANRFTKQEQRKKLQNFVDSVPDINPQLKAAAQTALKNSEANLKIMQNLENELARYFSTKSGAFRSKMGSTLILTILPMVWYKWMNII